MWNDHSPLYPTINCGIHWINCEKFRLLSLNRLEYPELTFSASSHAVLDRARSGRASKKRKILENDILYHNKIFRKADFSEDDHTLNLTKIRTSIKTDIGEAGYKVQALLTIVPYRGPVSEPYNWPLP